MSESEFTELKNLQNKKRKRNSIMDKDKPLYRPRMNKFTDAE